MAERQSMTIDEVVRRVMVDEHADVLRESVRLVVQELMDCEVTELIGAAHGERNPDGRMTQRNGYRHREWDTRVGVIDLQIPKLRQGSTSRRRSWSRASAASRRCCRWCSRRTCVVCRRVASISWSRAWGCGSAAARCRGSALAWTNRSRRFALGRLRGATRICSSTRRWRRSATAAGFSASAWWSPTPCTRPVGGRSSAWT